jgi:hypothetical protein
MADIARWRRALVTRILQGKATTPPLVRRAAFDNVTWTEPLRSLVNKVAQGPKHLGNEDFAAARASGSSEDQIFEIVVCAAVGESTRRYDAALAALAAVEENAEKR